jgi:predicted alpha/beta-fold hydrolase
LATASSSFRPSWLTAGGHRQTLLGALYRRPVRWTPPVEDLAIGVGAHTRLLLRASWQACVPQGRPALVIVHGLVGCDRSAYAVATGRFAWEQGWHVVRMNLRGAGESVHLSPSFHDAGQESDLLAALHAVAARAPRVAVAGFSVGGSLILLTLGRRARDLPRGFFGAAAVSPPIDLAESARALQSPANRIYHSYFVRSLREGYRHRQRLWPHVYERGRERGVRTVWDYDDRITAPYSGYRDAADYYARSSPGPALAAIEHPALILAAQDDPIVPASTLQRWPLPRSGVVRREVWPTGGHVGFVGPTRAPGGFWAAERVVGFLQAALEQWSPHALPEAALG